MKASRSRKASLRKMVLSPTYWMGVLISWAMPAASWPMASSFWAWRSCTSMEARSSSEARRSVMSRETTRARAGWPKARGTAAPFAS